MKNIEDHAKVVPLEKLYQMVETFLEDAYNNGYNDGFKAGRLAGFEETKDLKQKISLFNYIKNLFTNK